MSTATLQHPTASAATTSASASASTSSHTETANPSTTTTAPKDPSSALQAPEISSPHQLIDWVDTVLGQLESRFDDMNGQVTARMNEMSGRIDALESSIQDLIHGTLSPVTATNEAQ
ncbi:uncharacterized protein UTRI_01626 [Ustilago trichophora]|uniref:Heat shock factor binding protein 1 n=1 Tax=Ustilago trichophora TaxID=86804 RepID=A0A5C3DXI9_9BASI|nr:uncharacterized protein UTRI_01626 [Ustilago trichophora]